MNARVLIAAGAGILVGVGAAWTEATRVAQAKANAEFHEQLEMHKRVLQTAAEDFLARQVDGPHETEEQLFQDINQDGPDTSDDAIKVGGEMLIETKLSDVTPGADYLASVREYAPKETALNLIMINYITEDEYHEEDGRQKEQVLIHMGVEEPLFVMDGILQEDWAEFLPPNILVDMYQRCPPGSEKVLYVRNNKNDTDYEVIQEIP